MKSNSEVTEYWRQHVQAFESSGMARSRYCEHNQIRLYGLDYWRKKFRKSDPANASPDKHWIPLQIHDDQAAERGSGICLRIGPVVIDVKPGFDRELLTDVLRVIGPAC
jgi:hypothetical protein